MVSGKMATLRYGSFGDGGLVDLRKMAEGDD